MLIRKVFGGKLFWWFMVAIPLGIACLGFFLYVASANASVSVPPPAPVQANPPPEPAAALPIQETAAFVTLSVTCNVIVE